MGPSMTSTVEAGPRTASGRATITRPEFLQNIRAVIAQDIVDIMLTSASNLEALVEMEHTATAW